LYRLAPAAVLGLSENLSTEIALADKRSVDISNKLYAALYHEWPSTDGFFLTEYRDVLQRWFAALSENDRMIAALVRKAFDGGNDGEALKAAAGLPTAPFCPMI
jgi:hypothetical protein